MVGGWTFCFKNNIEVLSRSYRLHRISQNEIDTHRHHGTLKDIRNFGVEKSQQAVPPVNKRYLDPQCGEDTGVFTTDNSPANHEHRVGKFAKVQNRVGVEKTGITPWVVCLTERVGARCDQNVGACERDRGGTCGFHLEGVGVDKRAESPVCGHTMPLHVGIDAGAFLGAHMVEV